MLTQKAQSAGTKKNMKPIHAIKYVIALILAGAGVKGAVLLLSENTVGEVTFSFLILVSIFVGVWVAYSDRVKEFTLGLGKMSMVLSEMKETQRDIELREDRIKEIGTILEPVPRTQMAC